MKLTDEVHYTPQGVASKVIVENSSGMAIEMALEKGASIGTHTAEADVLVQILEGVCEFTIEGTVHRLEAGDFITIPPATRHSLFAPERFKVLVTKLYSK